MQRALGIVFVIAVCATIAAILLRVTPRSVATAATDAGATAATPGEPVLFLSTALPDAGELAIAPLAPPSWSEPPPLPEERVDAGGALLPSGAAPPPLGDDAPKNVVFGVVLVQYQGAQGATSKSRTREEAQALAIELAELAQKDFAAAVAKGDVGSAANLGSIERQTLEPAPEYVLFTLPKGGVSDPVDTPRGFWIVRRIE